MSFVTLTNELNVYDGSNYSLSATVPLNNSGLSFGKVARSGDEQWITAAPICKGPLPIYRLQNNQLTPTLYVKLQGIRSSNFYNCTNRYVAVGCDSGKLVVWDLREKKISLEINTKRTEPCDFVVVSSHDKFIAYASHNSGTILIHGLQTNKQLASFHIPNSQTTSSLCFAKYKKNYLAATSMESVVCVWDVQNSREVFKSTKEQVGVCKDLAFSPINDFLIISVCMTKKMNLFDIREKKRIREIDVGEALSSVDILHEGQCVAVGSMMGKVMMYDLRKLNVVSHEFQAGHGEIYDIVSQKTSASNIYKNVEFSSPETEESVEKSLNISVMDILSPIQNDRSMFGDGLTVQNNVFNSTNYNSTPKMHSSKSIEGSREDSFFAAIFTPPSNQNIFSKSKTETPIFNTLHSLQKIPEIVPEDNENSPFDSPVSNSFQNSPQNLPVIKLSRSILQENNHEEPAMGTEQNIQNCFVPNQLDIIPTLQNLIHEIQSLRSEVKSCQDQSQLLAQELRTEVQSLRNDLKSSQDQHYYEAKSIFNIIDDHDMQLAHKFACLNVRLDDLFKRFDKN